MGSRAGWSAASPVKMLGIIIHCTMGAPSTDGNWRADILFYAVYDIGSVPSVFARSIEFFLEVSMATRPLFIPADHPNRFVTTLNLEFHWHAGFSLTQKQKNITGLHTAAASAGYSRVLEVSTKSQDLVGRRLSAFNLTVELEDGNSIPLESAFQGSKVFERGGPFDDLYRAEPSVAKRDPRLHASGRLVEFKFGSQRMANTPPTAFYDWLYINAVLRSGIDMKSILSYDGFTDIEFNPKKSLNCQARACAQLVSMHHRGLLNQNAISALQYLHFVATPRV